MSATPALVPGIAGKYQKKISDALYLDKKDSEFILRVLDGFAEELLSDWTQVLQNNIENAATQMELQYISGNDPGDEHKE